MADQPHRSLLRSAGFCIGIFVVVLVALQLYYLLVDEENAVHFSDHSTSRHGLDNMKEDDTLEGEYTYSGKQMVTGLKMLKMVTSGHIGFGLELGL